MAADVDTPATPRTSGIARLARFAVLPGAVAIGLALRRLLTQHLVTLQALAQTDPLGARARLATEVRFGGLGLFGLTAALGVSVITTSFRGRRLAHFPPPGVWAWGGARTVTGPAARRFAYVGMLLGSLLVVCSLAGSAVTWQMAERLLACRATPPPH
jgi:hypothetical protein